MRLLSAEELRTWCEIPTAVLSDEREHAGVMTGVHPLFPERRFAGQALTIEAENSDNGAARQALAQAWPLACIVVDASARPDGAVWGGNLIALAKQRSVVAVVVDGQVRDVADLRQSGLAVCSRGITPRGPAWGGRIGGPVRCGGVEVRPGDLIVGDEDGVIVVALDNANGDLLKRCRARMARETEGRAG